MRPRIIGSEVHRLGAVEPWDLRSRLRPGCAARAYRGSSTVDREPWGVLGAGLCLLCTYIVILYKSFQYRE
jgi:hypothetical protein